MSTRIRKILVGDLSYIQEYEEYFSEMSKRGLHLHRVGKYFTYFDKGEPKDLNYRIDLVKKDEKEAAIRKHRRKGWNFVVERKQFLIFSSPVNSQLKELYETPEEQKLALKAAKKEILGGGITNIIFSILGILLFILVFYQRIKLENGFFLLLTREEIGISVIIPFLVSFFKEGRIRKNLKKVEKVLDANEFLKHHGDYSLMKIQSITRKAISFSLILLIIGTLSYKAIQSKTINLHEIDDLESLPIVTIDDIETTPFHHKGGNFGDMLYKRWSYFIPKEYSLIESVTLYDDNQEKLGPEPRLIVDYYLTRFEAIAKGLEQDILTRENRARFLRLSKMDKANGFSCYGAEDTNVYKLLCRKGKQVVLLNYFNGTVSFEELIEIVMEKLDSNEYKYEY